MEFLAHVWKSVALFRGFAPCFGTASTGSRARGNEECRPLFGGFARPINFLASRLKLQTQSSHALRTGGQKKLQALGQIAIGISKIRVYERMSGSGSRRSNGSARIQPAAPSGHA